MQIFVRTLDDRTLTLDVQRDDTVNDVKELVAQRAGQLNAVSTLSDVHLLVSSYRYSRR